MCTKFKTSGSYNTRLYLSRTDHNKYVSHKNHFVLQAGFRVFWMEEISNTLKSADKFTLKKKCHELDDLMKRFCVQHMAVTVNRNLPKLCS